MAAYTCLQVPAPSLSAQHKDADASRVGHRVLVLPVFPLSFLPLQLVGNCSQKAQRREEIILKALPEMTGTVCAARQEGSCQIVAGTVVSGAVVTPGEEDSRDVNSAMWRGEEDSREVNSAMWGGGFLHFRCT